jgi:hypothetical protein
MSFTFWGLVRNADGEMVAVPVVEIYPELLAFRHWDRPNARLADRPETFGDLEVGDEFV